MTRKRSHSRAGFAIFFSISLLLGLFFPLLQSHAFNPDQFENDDTYLRAKVVVLNGKQQNHTFHDAGDEDWGKFYGLKDEWYYIKTKKPGARCNTVMELYDAQGRQVDDIGFTGTFWTGNGEPENVQWQCTAEGSYYLRVRQLDPAIFGQGTGYGLSIWDGEAPFPGTLTGTITNANSGQPVAGAKLKVLSTDEGHGSGVTNQNGTYELVVTGGSYELKVTAPGYEVYSESNIEIPELGSTEKSIPMLPVPPKPADLTVSALTIPTTAKRGGLIGITSTVKNNGQGAAGTFNLGIYLIKSANLSGNAIQYGQDLYLGAREVSQLAAGAGSTGKSKVTIPKDVVPGEYTIGVLADPAQTVNESKRSNNTRISKGVLTIK